jgi:hypothetical protein
MRRADHALLSEDFLGVYPDGFAGRAAHSGQLAGRADGCVLPDRGGASAPLGPTTSFMPIARAIVRPGAETPEDMLVTSIWERREGGWVNIFSQDTPLTGEAVP